MFKKIVNRYLDNYYTDKFIRHITLVIRNRYFLDIEVEQYKNGMVYIKVKPTHYNKYTNILDFHKGDSLNHLVNLREIETEYVIKRINELSKDDSWSK